MSYTEKRNMVEKLQEEISSYGEYSPEIKKKIQYKFRLDWNYYSNSMEGNTLTKEETRSIMIKTLNIHSKATKDVLEMKGHDEVVEDIFKIGKGELRLSEKRIQNIHSSIMYEEAPAFKEKIGKWKTEFNHILNYKGERFDFAAPVEVKEQIHQLIDRTNAAIDQINHKKKGALHPLDIAFQFHIEYLTIHPFYDGNGRTARLLTNLLLISFGFPPLIIKKEDKDAYYKYLADIQCYGGNKDVLFEMMAALVVRSQKMVLDAIQGKSIEEPDDLDKQLALLDRELQAYDPEEVVKVKFNSAFFFEIYQSWLGELFKKTIPLVQKFNRFFKDPRHHIFISDGVGGVYFADELADDIIQNLLKECKENETKIQPNTCRVDFDASYGIFIKGGLKTFGCNYGFQIKFDLIKYEIFIDEFSENQRKHQKYLEKLLHKPLADDEIEEIAKLLSQAIYMHIDYHTRKNGIR
ncbi:MAG: Fic family protein [Saprospiraceae bacterium]